MVVVVVLVGACVGQQRYFFGLPSSAFIDKRSRQLQCWSRTRIREVANGCDLRLNQWREDVLFAQVGDTRQQACSE